MVQTRWQELSRSECFALLAGRRLGRLVLVDERGPVAFPVNYVLDRQTVVIRTDEGTKLSAASRGAGVAFEIDATDQVLGEGWSVLVRGEAIEVTDAVELARLRQLPLRPVAPGAKSRFIRILPSAVSGRRIAGSPGRPSEWWG